MTLRFLTRLALGFLVIVTYLTHHGHAFNSFSVKLTNSYDKSIKRILFHNVSLGLKHDYRSLNASAEYCSLLKHKPKVSSDGSLRLSYTPNRRPQKESVTNAKLVTVLVDDNLYLLTTWESWKPNYFLSGKRSVVILFDYMKYEILKEQKNSIQDLDSFYRNLFEINLGLIPACVELHTDSSAKRPECSHQLNLDQGYRVYSYSGPTNMTNYGVVFASVYKFPNPYLSQLYDDKEYGSIKDWKDVCFRGFFDFIKGDDNLARCMSHSRFNDSSLAMKLLLDKGPSTTSESGHHDHKLRRRLAEESYTYIKYNTWYPHGSFHLQLIDYFDYFMKLDSDVWLHRPIPADMLTHMAHDGAVLATGFTELTRDGDRGQVNETNKYVSTLAHDCNIKHLVPAFHPKVIKEYNAVNYGNFMVTWLGFFTSPQVMHYSRAWSKAPSMFHHRWGDQQYWTIAILWFQRHKYAPLVTYLNYSDFRSHLWGDIDKSYLFNHKISCVRLKQYEDIGKYDNGVGQLYTTNASVEESLAVKMRVFHDCNLTVSY